MFVRLDARTASVRRWRCLSCSPCEVATTVRLRVVRSDRRPGAGPRQTTLLRLPAFKGCCNARASYQERYWKEVRQRLEDVAGLEEVGRRALLLEIAEKLSGFLGPRQAPGDANGAPVVLRGRDDDGRPWVQLCVPPDVRRWKVLPAEVGLRLREAMQVEEIAREVEAASPVDPSSVEFVQSELKGAAGALTCADLRAEIARLARCAPGEIARAAREVAERARVVAWLALQSEERDVGDVTAAHARLRRLMAEEARSGRDEGRCLRGRSLGRRRALSERLECFLWAQSAERLLVVDAYLRGKTQAEAGQRVRRRVTRNAAQLVAHRHLEAFRKGLDLALEEEAA